VQPHDASHASLFFRHAQRRLSQPVRHLQCVFLDMVNLVFALRASSCFMFFVRLGASAIQTLTTTPLKRLVQHRWQQRGGLHSAGVIMTYLPFALGLSLDIVLPRVELWCKGGRHLFLWAILSRDVLASLPPCLRQFMSFDQSPLPYPTPLLADAPQTAPISASGLRRWRSGRGTVLGGAPDRRTATPRPGAQ